VRCRHCRREVLWGTLFCPHCWQRVQVWSVGWTLYLTLLGIVLTVLLLGLTEFFYAQHREPSRDEWLFLGGPINAVTDFISKNTAFDSEFRLEPRGGFNLQIYLPKGRFESLPERKRGEFLDGVLRLWCANIPDTAFFPFVQVRDLQTRSELATARCPLRNRH